MNINERITRVENTLDAYEHRLGIAEPVEVEEEEIDPTLMAIVDQAEAEAAVAELMSDESRAETEQIRENLHKIRAKRVI